jgi:hypothetical protein
LIKADGYRLGAQSAQHISFGLALTAAGIELDEINKVSIPVFQTNVEIILKVFTKSINGFDDSVGICCYLGFNPVSAAIPCFLYKLCLDNPRCQCGILIFSKLKILHFCFTFQICSQLLQKESFYFPQSNGTAGVLAIFITSLEGIFFDKSFHFGKRRIGEKKVR